MKFLEGWQGTLVVDAYSGYDAALSLDGRSTAYCLAHARRKFDELFKANASAVAAQAIQRIEHARSDAPRQFRARQHEHLAQRAQADAV